MTWLYLHTLYPFVALYASWKLRTDSNWKVKPDYTRWWKPTVGYAAALAPKYRQTLSKLYLDDFQAVSLATQVGIRLMYVVPYIKWKLYRIVYGVRFCIEYLKGNKR